MKFIISLLISIVFILNTGMSCDDDYAEPVKVELTSVEIYNINNEGQYPIISDEPVKKEAYMIGVKYVTEVEGEAGTGYRFQPQIKSEQIFTNVDIDTEYPAGSDVSSLFVRTIYMPKGLDHAFVMKKVIPAGTYSFKLIVTTNDDKIFEVSSNPIKLY